MKKNDERGCSPQTDWPLYHPLWFFSLRIYQVPRVAQQCLQWQNQWGVDVNLLLACVWLGRQGGWLSQGEFDELASLAHDWQRDRVVPIRRRRQRLSEQLQRNRVRWQPDIYTERRKLLQQELVQEQKEQSLIWQWISQRYCLARIPNAGKVMPMQQLADYYRMTEQVLIEPTKRWTI